MLVPTGAAYFAHVRRTVLKRTIEEDEELEAKETERKRVLAANNNSNGGVDDSGLIEEETVDLLLLDPKEWKVGKKCFQSLPRTF